MTCIESYVLVSMPVLCRIFAGKLCLQQEVLAKKCVSVLVRELETSDDPVVRNNVVIILCDLCVRLVVYCIYMALDPAGVN